MPNLRHRYAPTTHRLLGRASETTALRRFVYSNRALRRAHRSFPPVGPAWNATSHTCASACRNGSGGGSGQGLSPEVKTKLETLLTVPDSGHHSLLDRLRKGPFRRSTPELVRALRRIEDVRTLGLTIAVSHRVPPSRVQMLARLAMTAKASALQRLPENRRLATLVAFATTLEAVAIDDALDLLDILITEMFSEATKRDSSRGCAP